jgi:hypothetical protein
MDEISALKHDLERYMTIANAEVNRSAELEAQLQCLRRDYIDQGYMLGAVTDMLGPTGLAVWKRWQENGVVRVHHSWGPEARDMTGEERAGILLAWEDAPREEISRTAPIAGE